MKEPYEIPELRDRDHRHAPKSVPPAADQESPNAERGRLQRIDLVEAIAVWSDGRREAVTGYYDVAAEEVSLVATVSRDETLSAQLRRYQRQITHLQRLVQSLENCGAALVLLAIVLLVRLLT